MGANTVKGPGPSSVGTSPAASTAVANVVVVGFRRRDRDDVPCGAGLRACRHALDAAAEGEEAAGLGAAEEDSEDDEVEPHAARATVATAASPISLTFICFSWCHRFRGGRHCCRSGDGVDLDAGISSFSTIVSTAAAVRVSGAQVQPRFGSGSGSPVEKIARHAVPTGWGRTRRAPRLGIIMFASLVSPSPTPSMSPTPVPSQSSPLAQFDANSDLDLNLDNINSWDDLLRALGLDGNEVPSGNWGWYLFGFIIAAAVIVLLLRAIYRGMQHPRLDLTEQPDGPPTVTSSSVWKYLATPVLLDPIWIVSILTILVLAANRGSESARAMS